MARYVLAIDQGTTSSRAFIVRDDLTVAGIAQQEFAQHYPQPGWVEHDPEAIWNSITDTIKDALHTSKVAGGDLAGIGITNQRETTVVWDRATGKAIHPAIVWQCRRTAAICDTLKADGHEALFQKRTGLVLDAYFSGTKIAWILDNVPGARARAEAGELCCGTIDSFVAWRLTGGKSHITDVSNASRTLLMRIDTAEWDPELCDLLNVPINMLPKIVSSDEVVGTTISVPGLPDGIPVGGIAGDQQSALFGQACFTPGQAKCTYGTGSFLLMNTGAQIVHSDSGLLTTVAWRVGGTMCYALEGASFIAGAAVQWLRDGLGLIKTAADIEALANQVEDSAGVYFVPAFVGLGAPHWRPEARGVISGITRGVTKAHLARATLEGIAFQQCDVLQAMSNASGIAIGELRVDGGASANNLLMHIQADLLGSSIVRPTNIESTAMGAAFLAGLAVGVWETPDQITAQWQEDRRFTPQHDDTWRTMQVAGWNAAVAKA